MPSSTVHPKSAALLSVPTIRPFKNVCRGQPTCPRCGESGHDSADCKKKEHVFNCKGEHHRIHAPVSNLDYGKRDNSG
ncbi:hypothetical protein TNCV_3124241 [Trichonephila clavipes]|nr:hypothetical protein TNCV_3124241 [Trichonephila clavipes]